METDSGTTGQVCDDGAQIVAFDLGTPRMDSALAKSKSRVLKGFADRRSRHIILQDHEDEVFHRGIKIREITP